MLPSPLVELSAHERRTLFRIANGDARSGTHDPADVRRLQLLALIEDEGPFIHMTALGKQRVERLGFGKTLSDCPLRRACRAMPRVRAAKQPTGLAPHP
jgi:hypothetical protein